MHSSSVTTIDRRTKLKYSRITKKTISVLLTATMESMERGGRTTPNNLKRNRMKTLLLSRTTSSYILMT